MGHFFGTPCSLATDRYRYEPSSPFIRWLMSPLFALCQIEMDGNVRGHKTVTNFIIWRSIFLVAKGWCRKAQVKFPAKIVEYYPRVVRILSLLRTVKCSIPPLVWYKLRTVNYIPGQISRYNWNLMGVWTLRRDDLIWRRSLEMLLKPQ